MNFFLSNLWILSAASSQNDDTETASLNREVASDLLKTRNVLAYSAKKCSTHVLVYACRWLSTAGCCGPCVNAGSMPAKCLFSITQLILNLKHSCFSLYQLHMITF